MSPKSALALSAITVMIAACSRLSHKSGAPAGATDAPAGQSPQDVAKPFTVQITQGSVNVPAATMPAGSQLTLDPGSEPSEFSAVPGATAQSEPLDMEATDASGQPLAKVATPMTVALDVSPSASLADQTDPNLCVFGLGTDHVFRVWRRALLTVDPSTHGVTFPTVWMGIYQAFDCGTASVPGSVEVNSTGTDTIVPAGPAGSTFGTCDLSAVAGAGQCWSFVGKLYAQAGELDAYKTACTNAQGSFGQAACPSSSQLGACVYNAGTTAEYAYYYYTVSGAASVTAAVLQTACEKTAGNKWFAPGAYTPTGGDQQKDAGVSHS